MSETNEYPVSLTYKSYLASGIFQIGWLFLPVLKKLNPSCQYSYFALVSDKSCYEDTVPNHT